MSRFFCTESTLWTSFLVGVFFLSYLFPLTLFVFWWLFANPRLFDYYDSPALPIALLYLSVMGFPTRFSGTGDGVVFISCLLSHRRRSNAMRDAMFLKPILVPAILKIKLYLLVVHNIEKYLPEMRLKRTPFKERRGNLQTSISHWTNESVLGSPCTHHRTNLVNINVYN